ncbi:MAG TPA: type VI secretion system ATPase TssH, partial [Firmicutes bacterium]|nr:type VI secretion system ATPase TssH [Bacillota bacterium]
MDLNRFTEKAQLALTDAGQLAIGRSHQAIDNEHLLLALLRQENGLIPRLVAKAGVPAEALEQQLEKALAKIPAVSGAVSSYITQRLNQTLVRAREEARRLKDEYVSVEHLLLALFDDSAINRMLREAGLTRQNFMQAMSEVRGHQRVTSANPEDT